MFSLEPEILLQRPLQQILCARFISVFLKKNVGLGLNLVNLWHLISFSLFIIWCCVKSSGFANFSARA